MAWYDFPAIARKKCLSKVAALHHFATSMISLYDKPFACALDVAALPTEWTLNSSVIMPVLFNDLINQPAMVQSK